ncbi:hypothetical protein KFK09_012798 [Dendrobium nobile]|uniref:Uncharacterized protein n=1 Tax=Dendrobium nobile TaxID=94219 RepID=A0A8T3BIQ9_DENNO|nr:hypothetical protein KFK09_012798 [Dendrobium nobile]
MGCGFLMMALVNVVQIKLGRLGCASAATIGAIIPLVTLIPIAMLIYIGVIFYAFTSYFSSLILTAQHFNFCRCSASHLQTSSSPPSGAPSANCKPSTLRLAVLLPLQQQQPAVVILLLGSVFNHSPKKLLPPSTSLHPGSATTHKLPPQPL